MIYLDSSDDEEELKVVSSVKSKGAYSYYLELLDVQKYSTYEFNLNLGFLLHNFADRFLRSSYIDTVYKKQKAKYFGMSPDQHEKIIENISSIMQPAITDLFDIRSGTDLISRDYIAVFNFAFSLSPHPSSNILLKAGVTPQAAKNQLRKLLSTVRVDLKILNKDPEFVLQDQDSGIETSCKIQQK